MAEPSWSELEQQAAALLEDCKSAGVTIVTAESCTGGLVAGVLTAIAGSSAVVDRGFVTYTNEAKMECLDVPAAILEAHGAVSPQTAEAMARGALKASNASISVSVTGVAGPGGGSAEKPVGLVQFGSARRGDGQLILREMRFGDIGRTAIRLASVAIALSLLREQLPK
jgi:nicotinamide-nucleotide amidase